MTGGLPSNINHLLRQRTIEGPSLDVHLSLIAGGPFRVLVWQARRHAAFGATVRRTPSAPSTFITVPMRGSRSPDSALYRLGRPK